MMMSSTFTSLKRNKNNKVAEDEQPRFATFYRERKPNGNGGEQEEEEEEEKISMDDSFSLQVQWKIT